MKKRREIQCDSITTPGLSIPLREFMDRISHGQAVNAKMAEHRPLPPDGEDPEDFDTGTAEYHDLNDVYELQQNIEEAIAAQQKKQADEREEKEKVEFSKAVEEEIARRERERTTQALNTATA